MCSLLKVTGQRGVGGRLHQMGSGVTSDRSSDQADSRREKDAVGWERNRSGNGLTPGLSSSLPSLSDSVLAALSGSFSPLHGKAATSCSQQHQEKTLFLRTGQTEVPRLSLMDLLGSVPISAPGPVAVGMRLAHVS